MDSSITKTQKRNLTDMQEKFLDVLFTEAQGNPREAARIAGYSDHSYPKVVRNLKKEIKGQLKDILDSNTKYVTMIPTLEESS